MIDREDIVSDIPVWSVRIGRRLIWLYREDIVNAITIWCVPTGRRLRWFYREDIVNDIDLASLTLPYSMR